MKDVSLKDLRGRSLREHIEAYEQAYIEAALDEAEGNVTEAARRLKISRGALENKMRKYGIGISRSVIKRAS